MLRQLADSADARFCNEINMHQYIGLFLIVLAVAVAVFIATSGTDLLQLRFPVPTLIRPVSVSIPDVIRTSTEAVVPEPEAEEIKEAEEVLETRQLIRIDSVDQSTSFHPYTEVVLDSDLEENETVDITGWTIKGKYGFFTIPQAQEIYSWGGAIKDIVLKPGNSVYLYSGPGPRGNFRLNKCMGYIEDVAPFIPSLPKDCPSISRSEVSRLSMPCQDYILSLWDCENPIANPPVPYDDSACHDFLQKLNYVGCVAKYGNDSDFLSDEWQVWLENQINVFNPEYDKVQLFDKQGNLIDEYAY